MSIGYPDWERRTQQAGNLYELVGQTIDVSTNFGPYYTADWQSVFVFASSSSTAGYFRSRMVWSATNPATNSLYAQQATWGLGWDSWQVIPVIGPWLTITVDPQSSSNNASSVLWIYGLNGGSQQIAPLLYSQPQCAYDASVAASSTVYVDAQNVSPGPATWSFHHSGTGSWEAIMQYWDWTAAAWTDMIDVYGPDYGRGFIERVSLPAAPVRLELTNSATTSATIKSSLILG